MVEPFVGIIRMSLNPGTEQTVYAPFTPAGPSLLNDLAFDQAGNLYVTDTFAATSIASRPAAALRRCGSRIRVWRAILSFRSE